MNLDIGITEKRYHALSPKQPPRRHLFFIIIEHSSNEKSWPVIWKENSPHARARRKAPQEAGTGVIRLIFTMHVEELYPVRLSNLYILYTIYERTTPCIR